MEHAYWEWESTVWQLVQCGRHVCFIVIRLKMVNYCAVLVQHLVSLCRAYRTLTDLTMSQWCAMNSAIHWPLKSCWTSKFLNEPNTFAVSMNASCSDDSLLNYFVHFFQPQCMLKSWLSWSMLNFFIFAHFHYLFFLENIPLELFIISTFASFSCCKFAP